MGIIGGFVGNMFWVGGRLGSRGGDIVDDMLTSMKRPCVTEVLPPREVRTLNGPGSMQDTAAEQAIPPRIWEMITKQPRM